MNIMLSCVAPLLVVAPSLPAISVVEPDPIRSSEPGLMALSAHEDASLLGMRAGAPAVSVLDETQRDTLLQAQASTPDLADLRAGELSNSDLTTIAIIALIVVVIAILL